MTTCKEWMKKGYAGNFWKGVCPFGTRRRRRKGRPRNSWMLEIRTGMRKKGLNNMEWVDREEWRRKIKLKL